MFQYLHLGPKNNTNNLRFSFCVHEGDSWRIPVPSVGERRARSRGENSVHVGCWEGQWRCHSHHAGPHPKHWHQHGRQVRWHWWGLDKPEEELKLLRTALAHFPCPLCASREWWHNFPGLNALCTHTYIPLSLLVACFKVGMMMSQGIPPKVQKRQWDHRREGSDTVSKINVSSSQTRTTASTVLWQTHIHAGAHDFPPRFDPPGLFEPIISMAIAPLLDGHCLCMNYMQRLNHAN